MFDGLIMRRIEDEKRLRPTPTEPPLEVTIWTDRGWHLVFDSVRELLDFLGDRLNRSTVYWVLDRPGQPLPSEWGLAALRTRRGWHFKAARSTPFSG
jgi:hypothetical protein